MHLIAFGCILMFKYGDDREWYIRAHVFSKHTNLEDKYCTNPTWDPTQYAVSILTSFPFKLPGKLMFCLHFFYVALKSKYLS